MTAVTHGFADELWPSELTRAENDRVDDHLGPLVTALWKDGRLTDLTDASSSDCTVAYSINSSDQIAGEQLQRY